MTVSIAQPATVPAKAPRRFFGEPVGLGYLAFTEAWERFSYYGMTALLVLYMSQALFQPARFGHVAGLATLRGALQAVSGPLSPLALASEIFGLYTGLIYFTPVLGGLVADRLTGRRVAVVSGALMMCAGHFAMAFDASFLFALGLLIMGCGLLKGNISTQVGALYAAGDGVGRSRGFSIFSMGINVGAVGGPVICGLLAQTFGWHAGFLLAGVLMLMGLITYLAGWRHFAPAAQGGSVSHAPLNPAGRRVAFVLIGVMALTIFQSVAYFQNTDLGLVWIERNVDLTFGGFHIPVAWFAAIDPAASIAGVPLLFALWKYQERKGRAPDEIGKIAVGAGIAAAANLLLVAACLKGGRVSVLVPLAYDILLGLAFLYYWPILLALVSRTAPPRIKSTLMGAAFTSIFVANLIIGWLGARYETMPSWRFWLIHAGVGAVGCALAARLAPAIRRGLQGAAD